MLLCLISLVGILTNNLPFCRDYSSEYRCVLGYSDCKNILEKIRMFWTLYVSDG